jgi:guanine deaminase
MALFQNKYERNTIDTDFFVAAANEYIDKMYRQPGRRVTDSFFHAIAAYLSDLNIKQKNGGPFGAVIVEYEGGLDKDGKGIGKPRVIGVGANHVVPNSDPSAHAEMEAYRDAARRKGSSDLKGAVLFTSCECCPMCLSVANGCGISRISYTNTRTQAEEIGFSDKLQYDMFALPRDQQMTHIDKVDASKRNDLIAKLGERGAVVLDNKGEVFATGDTDTGHDPTGIASINAVRSAVKKHAEQQRDAGNTAPVFCLPDGFTLVCKDIPHPAGLITADWARILRQRDPGHGDDPSFDGTEPRPDRIIHVTNNYEPLPVVDGQGQRHVYQDTQVTYQQPTLPDVQRAIPTDHFDGRIIPAAAKAVFDSWKEGTKKGAQFKY